ncbi:FtsX-like permease family protein [Rhodocytophaga rosea]|uniref:FtsX-like permease family protein n=1 Tax=Rhodocytophaga rosea TaxID=2704465 RepID=A0A6C0GR53_9BACT|nr:ABC transporter permease [Rhodocytophaga rosea]QHT69980.1 FtsX-like permease family protein [Rhodocytophaga rosea]
MKPISPPPAWLTKLLQRLHPSDSLEEVEGDLEELYAYWYNQYGKPKADVRYLLAVLSVLPPFVRQRSKKHSQPLYLTFSMIHYYIKHIRRGLARNKTYALLNMVGLTAGLVCFSLIALWVSDELSYDRFNKNYDRIFRLTALAKTESGVIKFAVSSAPMAKALKEDYAEVENTVRLDLREEIITHQGEQVLEKGILLADPSFFDVFTYQLTRGDVATALHEPYSIILTESAAKKYFGDSDPIGQTLLLNMYDTGYGASYKITGVMADPPYNAHFTFTMIVSFKTVEVAKPDVLTVDGWGDGSYYTYVLVKEGVDYKAFSDKIAQFYGKYVGERFAQWREIYFYQLQPLSDIYLRSHLQYELAATGNEMHVYIFSTIGIFILLLAGINYMNLATAQAVSKAKETGIKKVVGAFRHQLMIQYLLESILLAMAALMLAFVLCYLLQPLFFQITGKNLSLFTSPMLVVFLIGISLLLGMVSGIYPAFIISGFKPIVVLKGNFKSATQGIVLRKLLVVSQFVITILLISSIIIIDSQLTYIKNKDLGYNKDALLFLRVHGNADVVRRYAAFATELETNPIISGATVSNTLLGSLPSGESETVDAAGNKVQVNTARMAVDSNFIKVYGLHLLAGRNFDKVSPATKVLPVIVNESAIQRLGWKDASSAIGKPFNIGNQQGSIIGVVKDFHFSRLQHLIEPLAMYPSDGYFSRITLRTNVSQPAAVTAWLEKTWKKHFPGVLLDYIFSDSAIEAQYRAEERFARIFLYFSVLSLVIACLGLYGLIAYTTSQKTKEIGIRKVLGATATGIAGTLTKDFLKLVVLAFLIATPLAWFLMSRWLEDFAYRISISPWMFASAGLAVILIALLTISYQTIKAALANPVSSLRSE